MTADNAADDAALLARYAATRSEADFRAIVERYAAMVYSACLRRLGGGTCDAEEASQAVFAILSRRAHRMSTSSKSGLIGWLLVVSRHVCLNLIRDRERRMRREMKAAATRHHHQTEPHGPHAGRRPRPRSGSPTAGADRVGRATGRPSGAGRRADGALRQGRPHITQGPHDRRMEFQRRQARRDLVWARNASGPGAPVPLNRATPLWIGPLGNKALPGETKRVFGKNLSRNHGTKESHVYLKPLSGGAWSKAEVIDVNPYAVAFRIPKGQAPGTYDLYVHNGHGGPFGFGGPVKLTVEASRWTRDPSEILVKPSGADDAPAIQQAIDAQSARPNGGTVRPAAGTYTTRSQINLKGKVRLAGAGRDKTSIRVELASPQQGAIHLFGDHMALEDLTLHLAEGGRPPNYGHIKSAWPYVHKDVRLSGIRLSGDPGTRNEGSELRIDVGEITGCEFHRHINTSGGGDVTPTT